MADSAKLRRRALTPYLWMTVGVAVCGLAVGCERSEKIVEVKGPGGGIEIKKTTTTSLPSGIDIKPTGKTTIEVETTKKSD